MSKLFMSLQLSPENFLQLQAQAKTYMLDSTHPERQNCVGSRGKGDNMDMVKLRLFNCVRDFLNDGSGEQFFGEHVDNPDEKEAMEAARALGEDKIPNYKERLVWPRDGGKIIHLVTPLMRRMVTNERQRQYAIETRKGGTKKKGRESSIDDATQPPNSPSTHNIEQQLQSAFDPNLIQPHNPSRPGSPSAPNDALTRDNFVPTNATNKEYSERNRAEIAEAEASPFETTNMRVSNFSSLFLKNFPS